MAKKAQATSSRANLPARREESHGGKSTAVGKPLAERMRQHAGQGVSTDASDNLVPLLAVLQGQSPQCMKKNPEYIEGAEAGDILLKGAANPLVKGEDGFLFQACDYRYDWVKWRPRKQGGGLLGRAEGSESKPPDGAKQVKDKSDDGKSRMAWKDDDGNDWIFTRYFSGHVFLGDKLNSPVMGFVIPLKSTGHTVAKQWMTSINQLLVPGEDPPLKAAIFASIWHIVTKHRSNVDGEWYVLEPKLHYMLGTNKKQEELDGELFDRGLVLSQAFTSGAKRMEEEVESGVGEGTGKRRGRGEDEHGRM